MDAIAPMLTLEAKKETTIQVHLRLPFYGKADYEYFFIQDENRGLRVSIFAGMASISTCVPYSKHTAESLSVCEQCTREEFEEALVKAEKILFPAP